MVEVAGGAGEDELVNDQDECGVERVRWVCGCTGAEARRAEEALIDFARRGGMAADACHRAALAVHELLGLEADRATVDAATDGRCLSVRIEWRAAQSLPLGTGDDMSLLADRVEWDLDRPVGDMSVMMEFPSLTPWPMH